MGGNALQRVKTYRKPLVEYNQIKTELLKKLADNGIKAEVVIEFPGKLDFGDIDILVDNCHNVDIREIFNPNEIVRNGDVISFDYCLSGSTELIQVDFIKIPNIDMAQFYFVYGDIGGILGRITNSIGLKFGHLGL